MKLTRKALCLTAAASLMAGTSAMPSVANAGNGGAIALGALGGFAAGTLIGNAAAAPRYYAPPPPPVYAYPAYAPVYTECIRHRVWGPYGWRWITEC